MNSIRSAFCAVAFLAAGSVAQAAPIILTVPTGGNTVTTLTNVTLANTITFNYQFTNVVYTGSNFLQLNASVVNPPPPFPVGQFTDNVASNTGVLFAAIDTSSLFGQIRNLAFTGNTFGARNSATITIDNVTFDSRKINEVPEPGTLVLLALGLAGVGVAGRRRRI